MCKWVWIISMLLIALWVCTATGYSGADDRDLEFAMAGNEGLCSKLTTAKGAMQVSLVTRALPGVPTSADSRQVSEVQFFRDDTHFRSDSSDLESTYAGKENPLRSRTVSEDDHLRFEHVKDGGYAYIFEKMGTNDRFSGERYDPRLLLITGGLSLREAYARVESKPDITTNVTKKGTVVSVEFVNEKSGRRLALECDLSLGGAVTRETEYRNGKVVEETVREFKMIEGSDVPQPVSVSIKGTNAATGIVVTEVRCVFTDFQYLDSIDKETFTFKGMGVPDGTRVVDRTKGDLMYVLGGAKYPGNKPDRTANLTTGLGPSAGTANSGEPVPVSPQGTVPSRTSDAQGSSGGVSTDAGGGISVKAAVAIGLCVLAVMLAVFWAVRRSRRRVEGR